MAASITSLNRASLLRSRRRKLSILHRAISNRFRRIQVLPLVARHITSAALLLLFLTGGLYVTSLQLGRLLLLDEVGYGDSYILYDVHHFNKTGVTYRDPSQPPYLPAQYSPLVYRLYALPSQLTSENIFLGPRLTALAAFSLCIAMVLSIVRVLIPVRAAWWWGLLMAISITSLENWPVQLRGDFPGIFFGLAAIRLLLVRSRHAVLAAGLCAGFATQFKFTYVAALVAGTLWLLSYKRWKEFAVFVAAGVSTSLGLYIFFWLREPRMISQMTALAPGIRDIPGWVQLLSRAIREPVVLLALPALPLIVLRPWPRWRLLLLFILVSFGVAGLTDLHAGGDINYFHEGLLALTPLAVLGAWRLIIWSRERFAIAVFLTGLILLHFWLVDLRHVVEARSKFIPWQVAAQNGVFRGIENVLRGQHIFSTIPRMALLDPEPALMEPYLLSYMQQLGKVNPQPIVERIRSGEFDLVITAQRDDSWRGVSKIGPDLGSAIVAAYAPHCTLAGSIFYLPRQRPESASLLLKLQQAGCMPYHQPTTPSW
jgi:hypothetical protein